jgi:hypothetical protein
MRVSSLNRWVAAAAAVLLAVGGLAGPVVIDGTDANDHGAVQDARNVDGWFYMQRVLETLARQLRPDVAKVVVDLGTTEPSQARDAINSAFALSSLPADGWVLEHVDGPAAIEAWLLNLSPSNTGILYIPTAGNTQGDLDEDELTVINAHATNIADFVSGVGSASAGGGLFAMAESPLFGAAESYGWLKALLPGISVVDVGGGGIGTDITLTAEGACALRGLSSADLSAGPWHNYFQGDFGPLEVLATAPDDAGVERAVILGGGGGTQFGGLHPFCITRDARYWFTHPDSAEADCATLKRAIETNGGGLNAGFLCLPTVPRRDNFVEEAQITLMESLGLFWRSQKKTGELGGTQNLGRLGSKLCRERKRLAVELVAATANTVLLGTQPSNCPLLNGGISTNFAANLLQQARRALAGEDIAAIQRMTVLLRKFNSSGLTNNFVGAMVECSATGSSRLRSLARDPSTQRSCPGLNDECEAAEAVIFADDGGLFASAEFRRSVDLSKYSDSLPASSCGGGGRDAVWKISPPLAAAGRRFTVSTFGSNFDTLISVRRGNCGALAEVACNDDAQNTPQSEVSFTTDGTNTYFIVVEGAEGRFGKAKIRITSP